MVKNKKITIKYAPITERYWFVGCVGTINNDKIRVGGVWFPFDGRWEVEDAK